MRVTIDEHLRINIRDIEGAEILHLVSMINGACLEERRIFHGVLKELTETPFDKLEREPSFGKEREGVNFAT